jgi:flagellar basal body L-ring protein FlgH
MKTLFVALLVGVLACAAPASAEDKKSEPASEATKAEVKKAEKAKKQPGEKAEKAEVNKDDGKKKVKKGGC